MYVARAREHEASIIREMLKLALKPKVISLAGGWLDPSTFPVKEALEIIQYLLLRNNSDQALQYGTREGLPQLREFLADWAQKRE